MNRKFLHLILFIGLLLLLTGCFRPKPVQHLAADACLITPKLSSRQDVINYLGEPAESKKKEDGSELWIYYQANKSMLRKTPYIGDKLGSEEYDVLHITFNGDIVETCTYRSLTKEEFQNGGDEETTR
jgi:hypothetical protein